MSAFEQLAGALSEVKINPDRIRNFSVTETGPKDLPTLSDSLLYKIMKVQIDTQLAHKACIRLIHSLLEANTLTVEYETIDGNLTAKVWLNVLLPENDGE